MLRRIVFGLVSVMGFLCAGQTLNAQISCLISIEPQSCFSKFGVWPGPDQAAFPCCSKLCAATAPDPTCEWSNTWRTNMDEESWHTEVPNFRTPISPETGFMRGPTLVQHCQDTMVCFGCEFYNGDPTKPRGSYCLTGVQDSKTIQLMAKVNNVPCPGIPAP